MAVVRLMLKGVGRGWLSDCKKVCPSGLEREEEEEATLTSPAFDLKTVSLSGRSTLLTQMSVPWMFWPGITRLKGN